MLTSFRNRALSAASNLYSYVKSVADLDFSSEAQAMVADAAAGRVPYVRRIPVFANFATAHEGLRGNRLRKTRNGGDAGQVTGERGSRNRRHIARAKDSNGRMCILHATKGWRLESREERLA